MEIVKAVGVLHLDLLLIDEDSAIYILGVLFG